MNFNLGYLNEVNIEIHSISELTNNDIGENIVVFAKDKSMYLGKLVEIDSDLIVVINNKGEILGFPMEDYYYFYDTIGLYKLYEKIKEQF